MPNGSYTNERDSSVCSASKVWSIRDGHDGLLAARHSAKYIMLNQLQRPRPSRRASRLFADLPKAKTVEDFEALLPLNTSSTYARAAIFSGLRNYHARQSCWIWMESFFNQIT
jgi:hypothetical protein